LVGDCHPTTTVSRSLVNVLLVEDNSAEARFLQEILKGTLISRFNLAHVKRLGDAIEQLNHASFDVVLLDLTLPDSQGLASLDALIPYAPKLPIVVLTNTNDVELAVEAVRHGAQDYLVKRQINQDILERSLRYAIERKYGAEALREANEALELRVQKRTAELQTANELLKQEVERRQRVQERLELAQEAGEIGTFEWNIQTHEVRWIPSLRSAYGMLQGSFDGRYDDWLRIIHPDDRAGLEQEMWQAVHRHTGLDTEFRVMCSNGETRWIAVKSSVFYDLQTPQRMIGVHIDITDKKQLEAQFFRAQRLESLGTLASGISHDLNNILTPILTVIQLLSLKFPNLDDQTRRLLEVIENSAQRGSELVKQILSFARGVEGKRISLQVNHLLLEVKQIIQQTFPKSIAISTDIPSDLHPILADPTQLHQVFMNLCVNARDAMPLGGSLHITAENLWVDEDYARKHLDAQPGLYVVIAVSDTGSGIAPDILHHIFDPFFTTKEVGKGTGLGLSAVLGIVKSHGGFVDVSSEVGQGSRFKIFLPVAQANVSFEENTPEPLFGNQELVLIVDDEAAICEITKTALEAYNYRVLTASDGMEAIALFADHKDSIYAVVMDIMMPTLDGLAAVSLLHQFNPDVHLIAMSGLNSTEAVAQTERLGFQGFLSKPFTALELLQILHDRK
jgi:two-component system, cell cycle sensor histidine kinase and response regulator CckA